MIISPTWLLTVVLIGASPAVEEDSNLEPVDFNRDIRPARQEATGDHPRRLAEQFDVSAHHR